ncbi:MAG: single-stranded-DNA-specific exonuclease RecJ [Oscillospiraceae bacterium]|nr:single-stranded-DNA-specific exonuclease RecJ [Oscillospiraceae bacterium]
MKFWNIPSSDVCRPAEGLSPILAKVVAVREAYHLLEQENFSSPFDIADMHKAVEYINDAIDTGIKIAVFGDYDCDGVTATYMLYSYLEMSGADVVWHIPVRSDGYGLNETAIQKLYDDGVRLIITVDNGITAYEEARFIKKLGIGLIITDHHFPGETLPEAAAVINPHRKDCGSKYKEFSGAGVALKLIAALMDGDCGMAMEYFAEFAVIGTIGDIVPLTGENRIIVSNGISRISESENIGLCCLVQKAGITKKAIDSAAVAYSIAPRINAAGRLGSAKYAMELFLAHDQEEAFAAAEELCRLNDKRRELEELIYNEINEYIKRNPDTVYQRVIILQGKSWHHGVIGIVAARLVSRYSKPVIIISESEDIGTASGRSVQGFNIHTALSDCAVLPGGGKMFKKFGGHEMAAGFSIELKNIPELRKALGAYTSKHYEKMPRLALDVDTVLPANLVTVDNIEDLRLLGPYGCGNPEPLFLAKNLEIISIVPLSSGAHQRLFLRTGNISFSGLYFGVSSEKFAYKVGDTADLLVTLDVNNYQGKTSVNLIIKDMRLSGFSQSKFFAALDFYERIKRGEDLNAALAEKSIPNRENFAKIYTYIKNSENIFTIDDLYMRIGGGDLNYCKYRIALDVLEETGLVAIDLSGTVTVIGNAPKTDLSNSAILAKLKKYSHN